MTSESDPSEHVDPYYGINGLHAAWARWHFWLTDDLPRQWNELAALLGLIQAAPTVPYVPGGTYTPPPPPSPPYNWERPYPIPEGWHISDLSPEDQVIARNYVQQWPIAWANGETLGGSNRNFELPLTPIGAAIAELGWEAVPPNTSHLNPDGSRGHGWRIMPWGEGGNLHPGEGLWFPGI